MLSLLLLLAIAFSGFTALLLVGIGVVEAPWPILVAILVIGLGFMQWASRQSPFDPLGSVVSSAVAQAKAQNPGSEQALSTESLSNDSLHEHRQSGVEAIRVYRGIPYECAHEELEDCESHLEGTYRGQHWEHGTASPPQSPPPLSIEIKYRGIRVRREVPPSGPTKTPAPDSPPGLHPGDSTSEEA